MLSCRKETVAKITNANVYCRAYLCPVTHWQERA